MRFATLATVLLSCLGLLASPAHAAEARWLRYSAISPDGAQIVFAYKGDLWLVSTDGGTARALTSHAGVERFPVWSRDGRRIAFASDRHGNFDIFVMAATGGPARRLTWHSNRDTPTDFTPDGKAVLFSSTRLDDAAANIPVSWFPELYTVSVAGGQPRKLLTTPAIAARYSPDGKTIIYEDLRGGEDEFRKHHTSSVARDLRTWQPATNTHGRLTTWEGEDRNPVYSPDGKLVYYLSERSGSFNVWQRESASPAEPQQVTTHETHPVRSLSIANDGTLAYSFNGDLYVKPKDGPSRKLAVDVRVDDRLNAVTWKTHRDGATAMAISPDEDEVAFVVRGEVFVASLEHGTTRRITNTPEQERWLSWGADGRSLYYDSERSGSWNLYRTVLADEDEERFFRATLLKEEPVLVSDAETFGPRLSPDGKHVAYLHERDTIKVLELATQKSRVLIPGARNYSYTDGDIEYRWSPDSHWLAFVYLPGKRWLGDVGVVDLETTTITNVTNSGYDAWMPRWGADGRTLLFASARYGRRNHGGWGADLDVMAADLTRVARDRARLSPEEFAILLDREKQDEKKRSGNKPDADKNDKPEPEDEESDKEEPPKPIEIERDRIDERHRRMTGHSMPMRDAALVDDGEALITLGEMNGRWDLWLYRPRDGVERRILELDEERPGELIVGKDGKQAWVRTGSGGILTVDLGGALGKKGGSAKSKPVSFGAEMDIETPAERAHMFEHVWRQAGRKFYDPGLHGVDWPAMRDNYAALLPHVNNNHDFTELLSELLGELNASHTGAFYRQSKKGADSTAGLGLLFERLDEKPGLVIAEVLENGPADRADSRLATGVRITHIDGTQLAPSVNVSRLLNRKAGIRLRIRAVPAGGGDPFDEVLRPIPVRAERRLMYRRWVKRRNALVEKWSKGRLGYSHVRGMGDGSFRVLYHEALGKHGDKEGLIVDTRANGGGWLHDDLIKFLEGRDYSWFVPRGKERGQLGTEPAARWSRPSVVLVDESNYSDAHFFPYAYQKLGIGQVVGAPVPGTATAVWWETLMDPTITFGIPQVGIQDAEGRYLENQQLTPDAIALTNPEGMAAGEDPQLALAVEVLLEQLK